MTPPLKLATHTLTRVLRNSTLYIAVGWVFGYFFTIGELFSGRPPGEQSSAAFSAANISWFNGVFSMCMIIIMAAKLQREQFLECASNQVTTAPTGSRRLTILQCIYKLMQPVAPHLVFALCASIGGDFLVYATIPESAHKFKPILYIAFFWGFHVLVMADIFARHIFKTETVRGVLVSTLRSQNEKPGEIREDTRQTAQSSRLQRRQRRRRQFWLPSLSHFLRVYYQNLPTMVFALIAIVYVHAVSELLKPSNQWELLAFGVCSIALKLTLQELAKHIMIAVRRPVSRRVMVALVSTPTILVDTQVRMLLLRQNNISVSVAGTVLLAVFEIVVRAIKSVIVQRQTRRPSRKGASQLQSSHDNEKTATFRSLQVVPAAEPTSANPAKSDGTRTLSLVYSLNSTPEEHKAERNAEQRRRKVRVLHAAEIYADMYAEYIAIGCSYAILFYYRNHPQYQFTLLLSEVPSQPGASTWRESRLVSLGALQLIVEVVVDFLACVFEAAHGVEFKSFNQNDPFLIFFLAMLTFSNVAISAGMYQH